MTTALVLGATGFIGGHTALYALKQGWGVRGLRRRQGAKGLMEDVRIEWFEGDLDVPETLPAAFRGADIVFHAAGYFPRHSKDTPAQVARAVQQTRNVLDAAISAGVSRLIYTSSLTTIGRPARGESRLADERDHYLPGTVSRSAYYECKYAMESEVLRAAAAGVPAVVVNPTAVFGPGDLHRRTGAVLLAIARGGVPVWIPGDLNVVDVREVAMAQVRAGKVGRSGERYILGGHNLRLVEFLRLAAEVAGVRPPRIGFRCGLSISSCAPWVVFLHLNRQATTCGDSAIGSLLIAARPTGNWVYAHAHYMKPLWMLCNGIGLTNFLPDELPW